MEYPQPQEEKDEKIKVENVTGKKTE